MKRVKKKLKKNMISETRNDSDKSNWHFQEARVKRRLTKKIGERKKKESKMKSTKRSCLKPINVSSMLLAIIDVTKFFFFFLFLRG